MDKPTSSCEKPRNKHRMYEYSSATQFDFTHWSFLEEHEKKEPTLQNVLNGDILIKIYTNYSKIWILVVLFLFNLEGKSYFFVLGLITSHMLSNSTSVARKY